MAYGVTGRERELEDFSEVKGQLKTGFKKTRHNALSCA